MDRPVIQVVAFSLLSSGSVIAVAQELDTSVIALEEITVTAQRREQELQSVPISINALTAESMEKSGVTDMADLAVLTPGLVMTTTRAGNSTPYLRGVGTQAGDPGGTSSVATYVDGVFYAAPINGMFSFNNVERVEVIKGPQGTLFGQSATGGLIHVITRDPEQAPQGNVKLSYGNYETSTVSAYQTAGVTETLATDLSIFGTYQDEGFGRNLTLGNEVNYRREYAIRNKWLWTPSEATRLVVALDYSDHTSDLGHVRTILPGTTGLGNTPATSNPYDVQINRGNNVDAPAYGGSIRLSQSFGESLEFISTSAYRHVENYADFDQDSSPVAPSGTPPSGTDAIFREESDSYQQEFLLNGTQTSFDWTVGAVYFKDESGTDPLSLVIGPLAAQGLRIDRYTTHELESIAAFAQVTYRLTDATRLTVGGRYTMDDRSISGRDDLVNAASVDAPITGRPGTTTAPGVISVTTLTQNKDFEEPTWRLALDHDLTEDFMLYGSYSRGYKTGQFNVVSYNLPAANPERLDAYELGFKSDWLDKTLRFNAAVFYYDYQNIQLLQVVAGGANVANATESTSIGADIETTWIAAENLQLGLAVSLLNSEYGDYPNAEQFTPNPAGGNSRVPGFNADGGTTLSSPEWTASLTADYSVPMTLGALNFNLTYMHSDDVVYSVDQVVVQDAYGVLNASVGLASANNSWAVTLYGRNLADETYFVSLSRSTLGDLVTYAPPRTYGLEFSYRWGN